MTTPSGRIIAVSLDPYTTNDPDHLWYRRRNRRRGRMSGQLRLRVRYNKLATPWFEYLIVSPREMRALLKGTGWSVTRVFESDDYRYAAIIDKQP
jgi:hypothetical protein